MHHQSVVVTLTLRVRVERQTPKIKTDKVLQLLWLTIEGFAQTYIDSKDESGSIPKQRQSVFAVSAEFVLALVQTS